MRDLVLMRFSRSWTIEKSSLCREYWNPTYRTRWHIGLLSANFQQAHYHRQSDYSYISNHDEMITDSHQECPPRIVKERGNNISIYYDNNHGDRKPETEDRDPSFSQCKASASIRVCSARLANHIWCSGRFIHARAKASSALSENMCLCGAVNAYSSVAKLCPTAHSILTWQVFDR